MVICGCDESKGFDGFTVPGVGRSGRPVSNLSAKQQEERTILAICNAWLSLLQAYNQAIVGGGTTSLTGADSTTFVVDSDGLEAYFRRIFEPMFRPTPKQPTYQFTFKGMMECWLGLVAQDYVVVDKNLWRKEAEIRLQTRINADLAIIHSGESRNHSFGPPGKPAEARELPANPQRAYHVVKGSDSLKFLRDGKEADELLALKQSQSSDTEKFTTVIAAPAKKTQKKAKVDDPEEEGTTSKAPGEGRGLKKLLFSLSAMPMPLRVSTFANLLYPGKRYLSAASSLFDTDESLLKRYSGRSPIPLRLGQRAQHAPERLVKRVPTHRRNRYFTTLSILGVRPSTSPRLRLKPSRIRFSSRYADHTYEAMVR